MDYQFQPLQYSLYPPEEHRLRFAVHYHHATQVHYDLRMEYGHGVQSWVLTDGPSLNPAESRRILRVNDHPMKCLYGEGRIPAGNYGAGPLLMWDRGVYAPETPAGVSQEQTIEVGLKKGRLRLLFDGVKLKGAWLLVRKRDGWHFEKQADGFATTDNVLLLDQSVISGRRIDEI